MSIGILTERAIESASIDELKANYRFLAMEYQTERDHCEKVMGLNRKLQDEKNAIIEYAGRILAVETIVLERLTSEISRADNADKKIKTISAELLKRDAVWLPAKDAEIEQLRTALKLIRMYAGNNMNDKADKAAITGIVDDVLGA